VNFGLFYAGRRFRIAPTVYGFLEEQIFPLVQRASLPELFLAAALAGFSEELLFRGLLQPRLGLLATSAVFGILHGPSRGLLPLAAWAGGAGYVLGLLYRATGNLLLPTLVHALYDLVALLGVRCFWRAAQVEKPRAAP
jgi:membrane protease YdiL (CAAX protease family)